MTSLKKIVAVAGLAASVACAGFAGPALALPASGAAPIATDHVSPGAALPIEHVQYYGYGYGYPRVYGGFYGPRFGGYYGRGFYGRGYYGRGYGRGFYGRGGYRR